ncbi:MAG: response regulator [Proteobacteria bacterium]|nr:response regulator [Pseudomonadota bacterium]
MPRKILVVDNNPVILKLMENFLTKEGHQVRTAIDGIVALETLKEFPAEIIFVDLIMPKISGEKLCMILRSMPEMSDVALVVLSAVAVEQQLDFVSFGADACIAKGPFKEVEQHIHHVFAKIDSGELKQLSSRIIGTENVFKRIITSELLSSKRHFEVTLNTMAEGFVELTSTGLIVYVNPVAVAFAGVSEAKMLTKDFLDFFGGQQYAELAECLAHLEDTPVFIGDDSPFILNGRYLAMTLAPVVEHDQRAVIVLIRDITERKKAEQEMALYQDHLEELVEQRSAELIIRNRELQEEIVERQSLSKVKEVLEIELMQRHKMEALGVMATGIAHDFNNILAAMLGYAEVIRFSHKDDQQTLGYLKNITQAGDRGKDLIGLIKTFSRPADYPFTPVYLNKIIDDTLMLLHPTVPVNIEIQKVFAENTPPVIADPVQIQQVLLNLCANAIQAMRCDGGVLTLMVHRSIPSLDGEGMESAPACHYVELSVADTGVGIPAENMERIFDPYFTTRAGGDGTGLGLSVVHGIVMRHNGKIVVVSEPGQGTKFTVYLPVKFSSPGPTDGTTDGKQLTPWQTLTAGRVQ